MQVTTADMVLFWMPDSVFSNFYVMDSGLVMPEYPLIRFWNSEAAFMFLKAQAFGDGVASTMIVKSQSPKECKRIGRSINSYDDAVWSQLRYEAMFKAVYAKFSQNARLMRTLLATGDRILVEASPYDTIWGIGLRPEDPRARDQSKWCGLNLLGKVLMEVRTILREELTAMSKSM